MAIFTSAIRVLEEMLCLRNILKVAMKVLQTYLKRKPINVTVTVPPKTIAKLGRLRKTCQSLVSCKIPAAMIRNPKITPNTEEKEIMMAYFPLTLLGGEAAGGGVTGGSVTGGEIAGGKVGFTVVSAGATLGTGIVIGSSTSSSCGIRAGGMGVGAGASIVGSVTAG
jgi:hypothetical protein